MLIETIIIGLLQSTYEAVRSAAGYTIYQYFGRAFGMGLAALVMKIAFGYYVLIFLYLYFKCVTLKSYNAWDMFMPITSAFAISIAIMIITTSGFSADEIQKTYQELKMNFQNTSRYFELIILASPSIIASIIIRWVK